MRRAKYRWIGVRYWEDQFIALAIHENPGCEALLVRLHCTAEARHIEGGLVTRGHVAALGLPDWETKISVLIKHGIVTYHPTSDGYTIRRLMALGRG